MASFLGSGALTLFVSVQAFALFGGLSYGLMEEGARNLLQQPSWIIISIVCCGVLAVKYGAVVAFPIGGVLDLALRALDRRHRSRRITLLMGAGLGAVAGSAGTIVARLFAETSNILPKEGHKAHALHTTWIFWAALLTGLSCGALIADRVSRAGARAGEKPREAKSWSSWNLCFAGCLALSYGIYFLLWEAVPVGYEFDDPF